MLNLNLPIITASHSAGNFLEDKRRVENDCTDFNQDLLYAFLVILYIFELLTKNLQKVMITFVSVS